MSHRREAGQASGSLVLLLLVLCAAGAWNYHRNLALERASERERPFRAYAVEDLATLRAAHETELASERAAFEAARRRRGGSARDAGSFADNVAQFDRTSAASRSIREAAARVAEHEGRIAELDRELELRGRFGQGLMRHVKRLTTI